MYLRTSEESAIWSGVDEEGVVGHKDRAMREGRKGQSLTSHTALCTRFN
jgi:hypothetical protein